MNTKILLIAVLAIGLVGCGNGTSKNKKQNTQEPENRIPVAMLTDLQNDVERLTVIPESENFHEDFQSEETFDMGNYLEKITKAAYDKAYLEPDLTTTEADTLRLDSMKVVLDRDRGFSYLLEGYSKRLESYIISYDNNEEDDYGVFMLNKKTAFVTRLDRYPHFSPNGKIFVTERNDGDPEIMTSLKFYDVGKEGGIILSYGLWTSELQIINLFWKDDNTIFMKCITPDEQEHYFSLNTSTIK